MVRKRNRKQLQWQKPAHNKSSSQNRNNVRKENQQVHQESEPQDYCRRDLFRENIYEGKDHNKSVFEKARVKVSAVFPGCKIITCFSNITFEILHLIPRYPHVLPELVLLRTVEDDSILLGRIHRISEVNKKVYVRVSTCTLCYMWCYVTICITDRITTGFRWFCTQCSCICVLNDYLFKKFKNQFFSV